jgi:GNAT superfamily N-acetyltransferase
MIVGGEPGTTRDATYWNAVLGLLDRVWPGIHEKIALAERWGASWAAQSTPFAWVEDGRALAHVGVLIHEVRLGGERRRVAGVHAVCSDPDARGRGLVRELMQAANAWIDARALPAKLHTDYPDLYARFGYRVVPTHRFVLEREGGGGPARPIEDTPEDVALLRRCLARRAPVSDRFASLDVGDLDLTNAALQAKGLAWFHVAEDLDAILALRPEGTVVRVLDVIAPEPPTPDELVAAIPFEFRRLVLEFAPDRLAPDARAVRVPEEVGYLQVRGDWPDELEIGVPPGWEH